MQGCIVLADRQVSFGLANVTCGLFPAKARQFPLERELKMLAHKSVQRLPGLSKSVAGLQVEVPALVLLYCLPHRV